MSKLSRFIHFFTNEDEGKKPAPIYYKTVTGTAPITLTNAISHAMLSLTQYGKCEQDGTPTPSDPVDIYCNNGKLVYGAVGKNLFNKAIADANRIYGYFSSTGTTWAYASSGFSVRIPCKPNTTYTARYNGNSTQAVLSFGSTSTDDVPTSGGGVTVTQGVRQANPTISTPITITTGASDKWLIVAFNIADPQHTDMLDNLQVEVGAIATAYEAFVGGIYADGTPETLTVSGKNLFVPAVGVSDGLKKEIAADGRLHIFGKCTRTTGGYGVGNYNIPAGDYALSCAATGELGAITGITFNSLSSLTFGAKKSVSKSVNVSSSAGISVVNGTVYDFYLSPQIEKGSTVTDFQPYVTPQTVNDVSNLLAVGDYADTENFVDGVKMGKVGMKVLTGDNTKDGQWGTSAGASNLYSLTIADSSTDNAFSPLSTHFVGVKGSTGYSAIQDGQFKHGSNTNTYYFKDTSSEDVTAFKAFLAAEYAAGHPVIFLYPLATETTTQTTPHALTTAQGTNVVEVTSNVDPVTLKVEYASSVAP